MKAFGQMTQEQRVKKIKAFREAGLESKANFLNVQDPPNGDNAKLSVSATDCQVKSVPFPVLEITFDRAHNLRYRYPKTRSKNEQSIYSKYRARKTFPL